jgi:hypothetical protein
MHTIFWLENPKRRDHLEDLRIDGNIRIDLGKKVWEVVDWMHLAQNREQWQTLLNTVMNLQVP